LLQATGFLSREFGARTPPNHRSNKLDIEEIMRLFTQIGRLVESRWRDKNYSDDFFAEIAASVLLDSNLIEQVNPWEVIRWVHTLSDLPEQMDLKAKFGDPPITVFAGPRFYIDVYYWLDGTTSIHQHAFSGAFQVLLGSSLHSHYHFESEHEINPHFQIGRLSLQDVSLLHQGDVRKVIPGQQFIHSLFHLERPSVTVTIRTKHSPSATIQYNYLKPAIAYDPHLNDAALIRKVQTVELLLSMKHPEVDNFISQLIDSSDFQTTFRVLESAFEFLAHNELEEIVGRTRSADRLSALVARARLKHGNLVDVLPEVLEEKWRQKNIIRRRGKVTNEDHRFLLALLLNVPDQKKMLDLVQTAHPGKEPTELIVSWVTELTKCKIFGSHEPNVIGLKDFDHLHLLILEGLLKGLPKDEVSKRARQFSNSIPERPIEELANRIVNLPLFKSLFAKNNPYT
jgi:hypothetical protein